MPVSHRHTGANDQSPRAFENGARGIVWPSRAHLSCRGLLQSPGRGVGLCLCVALSHVQLEPDREEGDHDERPYVTWVHELHSKKADEGDDATDAADADAGTGGGDDEDDEDAVSCARRERDAGGDAPATDPWGYLDGDEDSDDDDDSAEEDDDSAASPAAAIANEDNDDDDDDDDDLIFANDLAANDENATANRGPSPQPATTKADCGKKKRVLLSSDDESEHDGEGGDG